jgi:hypothetical protein
VGELYCVPTATGAAFVSQAAAASEVAVYLDESTSGTDVDSLIIKHYYPWAATRCSYYSDGNAEDTRACQALANLCVLNTYATNSAPCSLLDDLFTDRGTTTHTLVLLYLP